MQTDELEDKPLVRGCDIRKTCAQVDSKRGAPGFLGAHLPRLRRRGLND